MCHVECAVLQRLRRLEQLDALLAEHVAHLIAGKDVVTRRHRRVRREHALATHRLDVVLVQLERLPSIQTPLQQHDGEERTVPFVHVKPRVSAQADRAQQLRAPHAKHDLLTQAVMSVATVQRVGEGAIEVAVRRKGGVEQQDRDFVAGDAANRVAPRAHLYVPSFDRDTGALGQFLEPVFRAPLLRRFRLIAMTIAASYASIAKLEVGG